ncbi:MAG: SagB/ThcOx family dehydrogenase, partial [Zoogloea sp.]|nr:SagB/ThcOx family dehydrogenase [Zoogloea sp.]
MPDEDKAESPLATVLAYHERTKHRPERYAAGPETLDWDAQPDPFRRYAGAPLEPLSLIADNCDIAWPALFRPGGVAPRPLDREAIGLLLEVSFALAAWKVYGPDRWAVRCNPSSGNLHPTEVYLLGRGIAGLADGLYHYAAREHGLEHRCGLATDVQTGGPRAWIAFSSIHWREAWKYGERAFRYCQLDAGHAIGALRYAAALLGWSLRPVGELDSAALAGLLGLDRDADFGSAEREDPDLLFELIPGAPADHPPASPRDWTTDVAWQGSANRLERRHLYHWPVIAAVAAASAPRACTHPAAPPASGPAVAPSAPPDGRSVTTLLRSR